ncbi:T6SS immunity protein Tli4 family protein [Caballeronia sp. 15715]|uniref:T6SS immunity protein Tli4 family protein n=1 Tax=Caballeronia sp. 15715 TaxID=3391030 RepID=UPI0039E2DA3B
MKGVAALLAVSFSICCGACDMPKPIKQEETKAVSELTKDLTARCVGRFVVDVPSDVMTFGNAKLRGVTVDSTPMTEEQFTRNMSQTEADLKAAKSVLGYQFLFDHGKGPVERSMFFIHLKGVEEPGDSSRVIDAYKWHNGFRLKLQIEASDFTKSKMKDAPSVKKMAIQNDVPAKASVVFDMLRLIQGRAENDIPLKPGVCFLGGFLPGVATSEENVSTQFVIRGKPDVSLFLETDADIHEETTLLQRGREIDAMLSNTDGGRTIRKGPVGLEGLQGEEWLMAGLSPLNVQGQSFMFEANSKIGSAQTPLLGFKMHNGWGSRALDVPSIKEASLTENEAVALWDAVSRTLRPRSNGF